ncbi:haloacid dehalogenase [Paenibacillus antibioticophila]|uniref:Cd(2+)-exporting ATPase n=1 Tax=Paenibacillus antibioticophila TaxID=1274374 RepID=A0A920CHN7_9BACL|nr:cation-translocating P-type ATPase [Paenibacillus antibioticophila]GIO37963.1 haloacid dehalogenase [Paenibacillus antibioticophila]
MQTKTIHVITLLAGILLLLAGVLEISGAVSWRQGVLLTATVIAAAPIVTKAFRAAVMRIVTIELLVTLAVAGAVYLGEYVESAAVTFLFLLGAWLESRSLAKTRNSLQSLIALVPTTATVIREGSAASVPVDQLQQGDRVRIRSGERIAVDGAIASGQAAIDEAAVTGEPGPTMKSAGDKVYSGALIDNGSIDVIAERVGEETTFARMIQLVEEAQESGSRTQKFIDRFAAIYTPAIVLLSLLVYVLTGKLEMALTFLVIACPGALVIGVPVSLVSGIGNGAKHGVLIKGGEAMERLSRIDTVVFDKTGTLTQGRPEVRAIRIFEGEENDVLRLAAEAETASEHPLGYTVVQEALRRGIQLTGQPEQVEVIKGGGIRAVIAGQQIVIGSRKLLETSGIGIGKGPDEEAMELEKLGNTVVFIGVEGRLTGMFAIADPIREEADAAIRHLRRSGVTRMILLTGDNRHTAQLVGNQLGLDEVHAQMLPEQKAAFIQSLRSDGFRVAMAGDGINDAPALATADIGLAMGEGGTDIAMETADIVLMADRLDQFAHAYGLAKATVRNMKQNLTLALGTALLLISGVLFGQVLLAGGMLVHELSVLAVILNAIRLNRFRGRATVTT